MGEDPRKGPESGARAHPAQVYRIKDYRRTRGPYGFSRAELDQLLAVYSRHVIAGEWKAYTLDFEADHAQFSVFAHARARPIFSIVKFRRPGHRLRRFALFQGPTRLRAADTLQGILSAFDQRLKLIKP